jgi:hypothetical protein
VSWLQAENGGLQEELLQMQHASDTSRSMPHEERA